jgi:hypothetical protein
MRRRSTSFAQADSGGWMHKCDDLFLARYRGRPCEICGRTKGRDDGHVISSCGHHLIFKGTCRKFRYEPMNIVILCPFHHSQFNSDLSPHSIVSTMAQQNFAEWVKKHKPEQYEWWQENKQYERVLFDRSWTYRDKYIELGGEIESKTGKMSDMKPKNHAKSLKKILNNQVN